MKPMSVNVSAGGNEEIAKALKALHAACMNEVGLLPHPEKEATSLMIQAIVDLSKNPSATIEGILVQTGVQIAIRAAAPGQTEAWLIQGSQWLGRGAGIAKAYMPEAGSPVGRA